MVDLTGLEVMLHKRGETLSYFSTRLFGNGRLCQYKTGRLRLTDAMVLKICNELGCKVEDIVKEGDAAACDVRARYNDNKVDLTPMWKLIAGKSLRSVRIGAGLSEATLYKIKAGAKPRYVTLRKIARYLGVTPEDLYEVNDKA